MKKILMIASESSHFVNFHIPYIDYLLQKGTAVFTASRGKFEKNGVVHTQLNFRKKIASPSNIGVIIELAALIRKEKFDAVYTNSTLAGFAGRLALILSKRGNTFCCHICHGYLFNDNGSLRSKIYLAFEKLVRRRTTLLAVMNKEDFDIARKYTLGREIVFLKGMGFDPKNFPQLSEDEIRRQREKLGSLHGEMLFLCVGEFSKRKNQAAIINACSKLHRRDFKMIFAGEGEKLNECKALANNLGLSDKILFLGHRKNVNLLYRTCDCLISASKFEGLPFNVMEALYCGEEVIVSDVKGNCDLVESQKNRYPFNDAEALADLMDKAAAKSRNNNLKDCYLLNNVLRENIELLKM